MRFSSQTQVDIFTRTAMGAWSGYVETGFNSNQVSPDITAEREWKR